MVWLLFVVNMMKAISTYELTVNNYCIELVIGRRCFELRNLNLIVEGHDVGSVASVILHYRIHLC